jgi:DNA-binding response OmpR family regulator
MPNNTIESSAKQTNMNKKTVLIIDDEEELCLLLKTYLTRKNFDVYVCHNLSDGYTRYDAIHPDILFIDNNLPDGTGWDYAISHLIPKHNAHVFFISAYHPKLPHIPVGTPYTVIEKPISFADLDKKLEQVS